MPQPSPSSPPDDAAYEAQALAELARWREQVTRGPGVLDRATRGVQDRINRAIPEKVHAAVTRVMEQMTRAILTGSGVTTRKPLRDATLRTREDQARQRIAAYRAGAAAEGGVAGAGGFLLAAADFPALIAIKVKLLFELAAIYGRDTRDVGERLYILSIFQLAFSSPRHRRKVYEGLLAWDVRPHEAPPSFDGFDWRSFQQEYRDYIDLAKLAQLIPVIGAPVGAVVNYRLLDKLGDTAMNAYRLRWEAEQQERGGDGRGPAGDAATA